jgi:integrase
VKRLGLPPIRWHSWRHVHASQLLAAGIDIVQVSRRLGHANAGITLSVYSHVVRQDDRAVADAIDALVIR